MPNGEGRNVWHNDKGEPVELEPKEEFILEWQKSSLGHFRAALVNAICRADLKNQALLAKGFPMEVEAVAEWTRGDMHGRLKAKGFDL